MPDFLSATSNEDFYVTQLKNKLSPGFIQFLEQFANENLSQCAEGKEETTIRFNYYPTSNDESTTKMLKMIQIAKGLVARLHTLPTDYANNKPYVAEIGDKNKLMPEVMTIIKCSTDGRICKIPIPNTKNKQVVANVVVPLLRFEESAGSIQLDLATRGKNKKSISTIQSPLQFGSAYMVRCKNHIFLNPDTESEKCCKKNTTQCALHCAKHQLDLNTPQKNTLILVFSYIYPTDENLRPPPPPEESWLNLLMFQEKYFSTVENLGDGLCLLYSISEFIRNHMDSSTILESDVQHH